ncbi:hypothetical protein ALC57_14092 [Trachymyrmex cornetzi]|uniref:Uncharacterized protein n=1 Tax=Trachymyrmex cornetzi TaxID=471704 RepID=A0A151IYP5_9HYME|nr:hypothetical protein ALC57_14092 [Trachymyrmex cornetzi]
MFPWDTGSRCTEQDPAKRIVGGSVDRAWRRVATRWLKLPYISSVTFTGTIPGSPLPVYSRLENSKSSNKVTHSRYIVGLRSRPRSVDKSLFLPYPYPTANNESFIYEINQQDFNLIRRLYIILSAVSFCSTFELSNMLASYISQ